MERFTVLRAIACPLGLENVDTDQLIPARFMKRSRADGYGGFLLHDQRFDESGQPRAGFALNDPRFAGAAVLVARRNFGTGSSREAAVYALWDYGIRAVIAPSFGDIFASNAVKNGLLPAIVSEDDAERLIDALADAPEPALVVSLETCTVSFGAHSLRFAIDPVPRLQLLNGWDDIDMTDQHQEAIQAHRARLAAEVPWTFPGSGRL
jgi:3-isopropylmalate/(R)-2-methylmalate dehydratase small subunit